MGEIGFLLLPVNSTFCCHLGFGHRLLFTCSLPEFKHTLSCTVVRDQTYLNGHFENILYDCRKVTVLIKETKLKSVRMEKWLCGERQTPGDTLATGAPSFSTRCSESKVKERKPVCLPFSLTRGKTQSILIKICNHSC